jgi:glycosyltransferase involved in cell wall biosynthesis
MDKLGGKKVLFVITKSNWGGAQAYVLMLTKEAEAAGAEVVVALGGTGEAGARAGALAEKLKAAGIRTVFLSAFARDISLFREVHAFTELLQVIRTEKPDVLHLNSSKAGGLGALAGRIAGVPRIIFTSHGWAHREPRSFIKRMAIWILSYLTAQLSHIVIVVSEKDYADGRAFASQKKLKLIRNGISPFALLEREDARAELIKKDVGLSMDATWVLAVSELHPNKGIDVAIHAIADMKRSGVEAELVVLGGGQEYENLTQLAVTLGVSERVHLLGFTENARTYLRAADIYILPSRKEGLPFALLEAGYAGLPAVASNTGGIPEIIEDGVTGILVPTENGAALSSAIKDLISNTALREKYALALNEKIASEFSETQMMEDTFTLYI